ncbi:MAG: tetratricopeptide repeat protein [Chitinophagaceae bacterium]|nr:tetratricopeptide repeat protein [Chitinophagaceae bacterium]
MKKLKFTLILFTGLLAINFAYAQSMADGKRMLYYEKFISAKNIFQQIITADPANDEAVYWLGQALIGPEEEKDIAGARAVYEKGLAANPNSALLNAGLGHVELLESKTQQARNHFETAISLMNKNNSIDVLDAVGVANGDFDSKLGDGAYAVEKLIQATETKRFKDAKVMTDLGDAYRKQNRGGEAQTAYEEALKMDPTYARAKFRIGRIYQSQGRTQEAIYLNYYNETMALDPKYTRVYWILHQYYYETDVVKSAAYLDKYLGAKGSDETNSCFLNAQMKFAQGLYAETIASAENCIAASTTPYPNLYGLIAYANYSTGVKQEKAGDTLSAMANFGKSKAGFDMYFKKQKPDKLGGGDYEIYAKTLLKFPGNEALAGTFIDKAAEMDTTEEGKVKLLKSVATNFQSAKMYGDAAEWFKKIVNIKRDPTKTDYYYAGIAYYQAKQYPDAIAMFDKYLNKYPDDIIPYYYKGAALAGIDTLMVDSLAYNTYKKAAEVGEATTDKSRIISLIKGSYRYLIIYAANTLKDKELALAYCDKSLLIDPTDTDTIGFRESISKMTVQKSPTPEPKKKTPAPQPKKK